jgi:type VI secretion system protein VasD
VFPVCLVLVSCGLFAPKPPPPAPVQQAPQPPPPTQATLKIEAAGDINANAAGQASPLLVRVYELKGLANFNGADFFALYEKDAQVLGPELARKQEFVLKPGESRVLAVQPAPETQFIALFAAFRRLDAARWRVAVPLQPHRSQSLEARIQGSQLSLEASKSEPAKGR